MNSIEDSFEYYILDEFDQPQRVSQARRDQWLNDVHISRVCVAESHLLFSNNGAAATRIATYFTGCDMTPYTDECCHLWESTAAYMHGEPRKYNSLKDAKEGHDGFVRFVIDLLKREGIEVIRRDIEIPQPTPTE